MAGDVSFICSRPFILFDGCDRGSEVVFELYSNSGQYYIRILWSGQPMITSLPLGNNGVLDMVPINAFFLCRFPS